MYLSRLVDAVPAPVHAEYYAKAVKAAADRRRLIEVGAQIARLGYAGQADTPELQAAALGLLLKVRERGRTIGGMEAAGRLWDELAARSVDAPAGMPDFGLRSLDDLVILRPGSLTIIGARTGEGKTSLAETVADHNARAGRRVLFASMEMRPEDLERRRLCRMVAGLRYRDLFGPQPDDRRERIAHALGEVSAWPGAVDYLPGPLDLAGLRLEAMAAVDRLDLLIVDYAQLLHAPGQTIYERNTHVACGLQALAMEVGAPILALAQLSRRAVGQERPTLDTLKESGAYEQAADCVILLQRIDDPAGGTLPVKWWVDKNRNGPLGHGILTFEPGRFFFCEA